MKIDILKLSNHFVFFYQVPVDEDECKDSAIIPALTGPAVCKCGNRGPWSATVVRVHPRTTDHRKMPFRVRVRPDNEHGNGIERVEMERGPDSV